MNYKNLANKGRYGDTKIRNVAGKPSHVNTVEANMIDALGKKGEALTQALGSGTRNPITGLPEYFNLWKELGNLFGMGGGSGGGTGGTGLEQQIISEVSDIGTDMGEFYSDPENIPGLAGMFIDEGVDFFTQDMPDIFMDKIVEGADYLKDTALSPEMRMQKLIESLGEWGGERMEDIQEFGMQEGTWLNNLVYGDYHQDMSERYEQSLKDQFGQGGTFDWNLDIEWDDIGDFDDYNWDNIVNTEEQGGLEGTPLADMNESMLGNLQIDTGTGLDWTFGGKGTDYRKYDPPDYNPDSPLDPDLFTGIDWQALEGEGWYTSPEDLENFGFEYIEDDPTINKEQLRFILETAGPESEQYKKFKEVFDLEDRDLIGLHDPSQITELKRTYLEDKFDLDRQLYQKEKEYGTAVSGLGSAAGKTLFDIKRSTELAAAKSGFGGGGISSMMGSKATGEVLSDLRSKKKTLEEGLTGIRSGIVSDLSDIRSDYRQDVGDYWDQITGEFYDRLPTDS